ncbi:unnamed protein product [Durusdinium trenchii]|uniref:Uncharacterized protein n=1 Tax=Durusdinium trenchii TaxID=1381693 RepID=A0ABP0LW81_9DINO
MLPNGCFLGIEQAFTHLSLICCGSKNIIRTSFLGTLGCTRVVGITSGWSYSCDASAVLRGTRLGTDGTGGLGRVVDVQWSFKRGPQENLDFLLSRINARSEATGHPSVVAVFGFGANIGDNQLHFGLARPSEVSGLGGCYDWRTTPQLSPLAHKYLHDFSWCVMDRSRVSKGFAFTMAIADGT